jgi:imidazolonepropionase-like amidohydrolase
MKSLTAINPSSVSIPVTRVNGVTTAIAKPNGGILPGQAALVNLYGYTPEQMYADFTGMVMEFPSNSKRGWWDDRKPKKIKEEYEEKLKLIKEMWENAERYQKIMLAYIENPKKVEKPDYYPEVEALMPVLAGEMPLMVEVNMAGEILEALKWAKEHDGINFIFTGVAEGWRVADSLAQANIPVITGPVLSTPTRGYDRYDKPYRNASIMKDAGVKVALRTNEAENVRNLPFNAAFAAAYGMGREEAMKAITIVPAEIFGVADQYGSIEEGKVANIYASTGDPFEMKSKIKYLFINGWNIPVESRHTQLYDEFLERSLGAGEKLFFSK